MTAEVAGVQWRATAKPLVAALTVGERTALGSLLRTVPHTPAARPCPGRRR